MREEYKGDEIYFIIGSDIIFEIEKWKSFEELIRICKFILLYRPGKEEENIDKKIQELNLSYDIKFEKVKSPLIEISSTEVRRRIKDKHSIKYLVPEEVEDYILKHNLYNEENING